MNNIAQRQLNSGYRYLVFNKLLHVCTLLYIMSNLTLAWSRFWSPKAPKTWKKPVFSKETKRLASTRPQIQKAKCTVGYEFPHSECTARSALAGAPPPSSVSVEAAAAEYTHTCYSITSSLLFEHAAFHTFGFLFARSLFVWH